MVISLLDELFEKGLLKRITRSNELALKSLKQARYFLGESQDLLKLDKKRIAVIVLYNAFFHSARALLFRDGVKEKSHYAVARYIEFIYVDKGLIDKKFLLALDMLRDYRHESQYALIEIDIDIDWSDYTETCEQFIQMVNGFIK